MIEILTPHLPERRSLKGITVENKFFTALRFYATGSYQRCVGQEYYSGMSQTAVHRCVHEVTQALANISNQFISLPNTQDERNFIKNEIMQRWGFPGVVGIIDGFHVAILKPTENEQNYINRKGYHSINSQIICDHQLKIRSIYANYGGSTHDSFIWRVSEAQQYIINIYQNRERCWFIGDSGYPLQPYLLNPFRNPANDSEIRFNNALASTRNLVERCIGLLKMRFRCILKERSARYSPVFVCKMIKACAVLHNMCVNENLINYDIEFNDINLDNDQNHQVEVIRNLDNVEGVRVRNEIVERYF